MNAIELFGLSKTYRLGFAQRRRVVALDGLSLTVEPGQVFGLLGPNGAGKSTTIKILLNLIRASAGTAKVFGKAPSQVEARKEMGYLPENPAPYEYLSGLEFATFCGQLAGLNEVSARKTALEVIERVGMTAAKDLQIRRYSKGMIQRISLAQSLIGHPRLLILDEPTSGLDVLGRRLVKEIILEERKRGTTVVFCSHIIPDVEELCDTVAVLIGGKLFRMGTVSELLASGSTSMELMVEGVTTQAFEALRPKLQALEPVGPRVLVRFEEKAQQEVVSAAIAANARILSLVRNRSSLEDVFVEALKDTTRKVGGLIA